MPYGIREPNWSDVRFDHHLASLAASRLRAAADAVTTAAGTRARLAVAATAQWRGGHRQAFDGDLAVLQAEATDIAARLRHQAATIDAAAAAATAEQRARLRDRERYRAEVARARHEEAEAREEARAQARRGL